jgi:GT2 family glycosyltransferase
MGSVTVSVITVNYNAGAMLSDCVASVMAQCDQIIVVDNASTDDSLATLGAAFPSNPKLSIIRNERNLGFAKGCNIGTAMASGEIVLFLNPDCVVEPTTIAGLIAALDQHPAAGMAGAMLTDPDGREQGGGRRAVPTPWRSFVRAFGLSRLAYRWPKLFFDFHLHEQPLPDRPIEVEAISGACMMVRRAAMNKVGLLDEGYFMHCEDLDWCMRFRRESWTILFVPDAKIVHYKGVCSRSRPMFVEWHKHKGMMRFYRKFFVHQYPGILMWLVGAGIWLRFLAMVTLYSFEKVKSALREPWSSPNEAATRSRDMAPVLSTAGPLVGVLGATSLVGRGLLPLLAQRGWQVVAFSRNPQTAAGPVVWREPETLHAHDPPISVWICLAPIWVLADYLEWLGQCGATHVVALSSTSRFTKADSSDLTEQELAAKFADSEDRLRAWAQRHGATWTILRPTLIYGFGRDSARLLA